MSKLVVIVSAISLLSVEGCAGHDLVPLVGEGPEIYTLIGSQPPDDPLVSPLAAARRLHQALVQKDSDMVWALLSKGTRRALDQRGAVISASGRELIDASTLPGPNATVRNVRYENIFFGRNVIDLELQPGDAAARTRQIVAIGKDGATLQLSFVREEDGWKLNKTGL